MNVFHTEMHVLTFVVVCIETAMLLFYQLPHYLVYQQDKTRLWYLVLLILLIVYNITGGLLPDPSFSMPIILQNDIAYGTGFLISAYFPFFFYQCLQFEKLRKHALLWSPLFLLGPYVVFFWGWYSVTGDMSVATSYGMIIPFIYSIWVLLAILNAIRLRFKEETAEGLRVTRGESLLVYAAVTPWLLMTIFSFLSVAQWIEVLCTNMGFVLATVVLMCHSVRKERMERQFWLESGVPDEAVFEENLKHYGFTEREKEVIRKLRQGLTRQAIADQLFIAETTVSRHTQNIYYKADVNGRIQLLRKLENPVPK